MKFFSPFLLLFWLLLTLVGCRNDAPPAGTTTGSTTENPGSRGPAPAAKPVPKFDRDSAYAYVAKQVGFGPRTVNSDAHRAARRWFVDKLTEFGAEVEEQHFTAKAFDGTELRATNVIGRYRPDLKKRVALYAHWDTRPFADSELEDDPTAVVNGADDGASGVGVLLEIARQLGQSPPDIGVDIVLLDAEDWGTANNTNSWGLGAQHYARNLRGPKPAYGILLDMVGARDARFALEQVSMKYAPRVMAKVWRLAKSMGSPYFVEEAGGGVTDDHYFINQIAGIPTIDIINHRKDTETGFVAHWHTGDDNLDKIDRRTLKGVGQVVLAVIYREAAGTI